MNKKSNQPYQRKLNVDVLWGEENLENNSHLVPLAEIIVNPDQPRRYFDSKTLEGLMESIQAHGILQPLLVQPKTEKGYLLIAGERRYRAAQALGLESVPVNICSLDDQQAWAISLVENLQREELNPVEETTGILKLIAWKLELTEEEVTSKLYRMQNQAKGKITHNVMGKNFTEVITQVFETIGTQTWESFVTNRLPLLNLPPDILEALRQGKIEYTKAKAIAKVKEEEKRAELLEEAIQNQLSLIQIKARIAELKPSPEVNSSENKAQVLARRLKQLKLWEKDKKAWKKVEGWLDKIENLLSEIEADGEKIAPLSSDLPNLSSAKSTEENQPEHTENFTSKENLDITAEEDSLEEELEEDWDAYAISDD